MSFNTDALTLYDTGALQYPKLHERILEITMPVLDVRRLFIDAPIKEGRTITFVKESGTASVGITQGAQGAPMIQDYTGYTTATVTPYKMQQEIEVPTEVVNDVGLPLMEGQLRRLTRKFALQVESDCFNLFPALLTAGGGQNFACTGKTIAATGTEVTVASTIGVKDLNKARRLLLSKNLYMTDILCDPIAEEGLRNLPGYTLIKDVGINQVIGDNPIGKIGPWTIHVSNAIPAGIAYCISNGRTLQGEYNPLGFFAIKQPIYSDIDIQKRRDVVYPFMRARYAPIITNGDCVVAITGLATS